MQPTTLAKAVQIIAEHTGKSACDDRAYLVQKVNEIRRALWKIDSAREAHFKRGDLCECVECYYDDCIKCARRYAGITLPVNVTALYSLSFGGKVINMRAEILPNGGCCSPCGCLKAQKLISPVPLKRDIPARYKGTLVFKVTEPQDKGKRIGIEYVDLKNAIVREDLIADIMAVTTTRSVSKVLKLTFPERCGWIKVTTEEGYDLGSYHPSIMSPAHLRIKMIGVSPGNVVSWSGLVEPADVIFDTDQVEFSNPLDWKNFFQLLDLHFKTGKSPAERAAYGDSMQLAKAGMDADLQATLGIPAANLRPKNVSSLRKRIRAITG